MTLAYIYIEEGGNMKKLESIQLEKGGKLDVYELGNDYAKTYKRAVRAIAGSDICQTVGRQARQHKHRKPD